MLSVTDVVLAGAEQSVIEVIYRIDPNDPNPGETPGTAAEARAQLESGNRTFATLLDNPGSSPEPVRRVIQITAADLGLSAIGGTMLTQTPFALVVGCADARVPIELILGQGVNDLFVLRVAGNVLGSEIKGSVDFALQNLPSIVLVVVLGHSRCGAVTAATRAFLDPAEYLGLSADHELRSIVNQLFPAVRLAHTSMISAWGSDAERHRGFVPSLVETAAVVNSALMAAVLRNELVTQGRESVEAVYGVYDLDTRRVGVFEPAQAVGDGLSLLDPPLDSAGFTELSMRVAHGPFVSGLMGA